MNNKISIIIPIYNAQDNLELCLNALLKQTHKNLEIICINDGSQDNSLEILNSYSKKDDRIIVLNQENGGPGVARNNGLKHASGDYIMFCDSDDFYEPNMCEIMLNEIVNSNLDLVVSNINTLKTTGSRPIAFRNYNALERTGEIEKEALLSINLALWNKIFKKSILDNYNINFPSISTGEDDAFIYLYLIYSKNYKIIKDKLYNYQIVKNSLMDKLYCKKLKNQKYDRMMALKHVINNYIKNKKTNSLDDKLSYLCLRAYRATNYPLKTKKEKFELYKKIHELIKDKTINKNPDFEILRLIQNKEYEKL